MISISAIPYLEIAATNSNSQYAINQAVQSTSGFLRTSSVVEAYSEPFPIGPTFDGCYDIAYYYMDTYTSDTMKASRFCTKYTAMSYWETNPRHAYIVSHGGVYAGTPSIAFSSGTWLWPIDITINIDEGAMENTDAMFLAACEGLANYQPSYPASQSFGKTFCEHGGVNNVIGCPVPIHAAAAILVTAYYYHFRVVYGYSAYSAINLAKAHTLVFLALATVAWPVSIPLALLWLNAGLGIPIPTIVANILLLALMGFSIFGMIVAYSTFTIILVDENYY
ncbi:MAG: hypothetical protein ACFFCB_07150 [Candidatus Odinarchaeota archaeon]